MRVNSEVCISVDQPTFAPTKTPSWNPASSYPTATPSWNPASSYPTATPSWNPNTSFPTFSTPTETPSWNPATSFPTATPSSYDMCEGLSCTDCILYEPVDGDSYCAFVAGE